MHLQDNIENSVLNTYTISDTDNNNDEKSIHLQLNKEEKISPSDFDIVDFITKTPLYDPDLVDYVENSRKDYVVAWMDEQTKEKKRKEIYDDLNKQSSPQCICLPNIYDDCICNDKITYNYTVLIDYKNNFSSVLIDYKNNFSSIFSNIFTISYNNINIMNIIIILTLFTFIHLIVSYLEIL